MLILTLLSVVLLALVCLMRATMTITTSWGITESGEGAGIGGSQSVTATGDGVISATAALLAATPNQEIDVGWDKDTIQALVIVSTVDCTLYTNAASTGAPSDTVVLKANNPLEWHKDNGITFPFAGAGGTNAVTKVFVTVAGAVAGTIKFRGVADITP